MNGVVEVQAIRLEPKIRLNVFTSCCYSLSDALTGAELRGSKKAGEENNVVVQEYYVTLYNSIYYVKVHNKFIIFSTVYLNRNNDINSKSKHNKVSALNIIFTCFDSF
jgi:hypothetical protein